MARMTWSARYLLAGGQGYAADVAVFVQLDVVHA